ncbi:hypothetical protein L3X38_031018 [Prunus dulcis]|uniref:Uncharacterized protein n=1 Tax=Prunus dulcis TaxID=3755 RepID=A0AAD4VDJ5_PRUDU|nr:hypothetical protein L3X38_031018 [Prunus dulcis]
MNTNNHISSPLKLSSFCDDIDETGSAASYSFLNSSLSGQASHIVLSCAGNFVSSGLKAKTSCRPLQRVDLEKRRAEKERAEKGHVPSGIPTSSLSTFPSI